MFSKMTAGKIEYRRSSSIKHKTAKSSGRKTLYWRNTFLRNELAVLNCPAMVQNPKPPKEERPNISKTLPFEYRGNLLVNNLPPTIPDDDDDDFFSIVVQTASREKQRKIAEKSKPFAERYWHGAGKNQPSYQTVVKRIMEDYNCTEREAREILTENV